MATRGARKWSTKHVQRIRAGKHELLADEPESVGGVDAGPAPFASVLSGLGACTSITLRMYAERKGRNLGTVTVCLRLVREETGIRVEREVAIGGALDDDQRAARRHLRTDTGDARARERDQDQDHTQVMPK